MTAGLTASSFGVYGGSVRGDMMGEGEERVAARVLYNGADKIGKVGRLPDGAIRFSRSTADAQAILARTTILTVRPHMPVNCVGADASCLLAAGARVP
jgi:hypothetical protein